MTYHEKLTPEQLWREFQRLVQAKLANAPGCHDYSHTLRVLHNAELILQTECAADAFVVRTAALFHDYARPEEMASNGQVEHAAYGAELVREELCKIQCTQDFTDIVSACIRTHRYRGKFAPETIEAKIVYDADKLDSIGAVGVGRAFHFAGRTGACLHNTAEEALNSPAYSRNDSAYREYLVKLRNIRNKMLTETGKRIAAERSVFMDEFFRHLIDETGCA